MTQIWDKIEDLAKKIEHRLDSTGEPLEGTIDQNYDWHNTLWTSLRYRRAHVEIVDKRLTHKIYILHTTIFPHYNDPSPIFGFDAVCGPAKITGAFHDFSNGGDPSHPMMAWFRETNDEVSWSKPRDLPDWARQIFSDSMVAAGNLQNPDEVDQLCNLALKSLDYYLSNVGLTQTSGGDFHMAQNRYCHYQKQNPQVVRSMVSMGIEEPVIKRFVETVLFPEHI
jgi:hypothetical protein